MKKVKKKYILIFSLFFLCGILVGTIIFVFSSKRPVIRPTVNVFGAPRAQTLQNFPANKPEFSAIIGEIKPASVQQQSITVYKAGNNKTPLFERSFYADGFRGSELTYTLSSSSAEVSKSIDSSHSADFSKAAEIKQNGFLGSLGCSNTNCKLPWTNFYNWDANQHIFALTNAYHRDTFQKLLISYQEADKNGCKVVGDAILSDQDGLSFTELYKKFPTSPYYCSKTQGIVPSNLVYFLQAEKTLQEIVGGENVGSDDIRDIAL